MSDVTAQRRAKDSPARTTPPESSSTSPPAQQDSPSAGAIDALKLAVVTNLAGEIASLADSVDSKFYYCEPSELDNKNELRTFTDEVREAVLKMGYLADQAVIQTGVGMVCRGGPTDWLVSPMTADSMSALGRARLAAAPAPASPARPVAFQADEAPAELPTEVADTVRAHGNGDEPRRVAEDELAWRTMTAPVEFIEFAPTASTDPRQALDTVSQLLTTTIKTLGLLQDDSADILRGPIAMLSLARSAVDTLYPVISKGGDDGR